MKKYSKIAILCTVFTLLFTCGCATKKPEAGKGNEDETPPPEIVQPGDDTTDGDNTGDNTTDNPIVDDVKPKVVISATAEDVKIKEKVVGGYDFTSLFTITSNGQNVEVLSSYIDSSSVKAEAGEYIVTCNYGGEVEQKKVTVLPTEYAVNLSTQSVSIKVSAVQDYDFAALFSVTEDGEKVALDDSMVKSDVAAKAGNYTYSVTYGGITKVLNVVVVADHSVEIVVCYNKMSVAINKLSNFDYTQLFSLYVDNVAVRVTEDMVDTSALQNAAVGNAYDVVINYTAYDIPCTKTAKIEVTGESETTVNTKNIVTYPNSGNIDFTSLFEVIEDGEEVEVTDDMITGTVDYTTAGTNQIVLTYNGKDYTSTVEVKMGVVIDYASSDTVVVVKGTNQNTYAFDRDFVVVINGIRFADIPLSYFDLSEVDFSTVGTYQAKLSVKYNEKRPSGISGTVKYQTTEKTINYVVVNNNSNIQVINSNVVLPEGTTSYNVYDNLNVTINGRGQQLTENSAYVDPISCYVQTLSDPIDFNAVGEQTVSIAIYVDGPESQPKVVSFTVKIQSSLTVSATDKTIFTGTTLYTKDLFTITDGDTQIEVTSDMITGKVNTFVSGIYAVQLNYNNLTAVAKVVVLDSAIKGTYHTQMTTIANISSSSDDEEGYEEEADPVYDIGDMTISDDMVITVNGTVATDIVGIDTNTFEFKLGSNLYTMYYQNGIVVLDPDNSIKLSFSDYRRPYVYFNSAQWEIEDKVIINFGSAHVLENTYTTYSIDTYKLSPVGGGDSIWYGLYIRLAERTSGDTVYVVKWGEVEYSDTFEEVAGTKSSLTFDGDVYKFAMQSAKVGKCNGAEDTSKPFAGKVFTGTVDGKSAKFSVTSGDRYEFSIDNEKVLSVGSYELANMKNGGPDYNENTVLLYSFSTSGDYGIYSYKFALNLDDLTFSVVERDSYYGKYIYNNMYIFLDGYGTGFICFNSSSEYVNTQLTYTQSGNVIDAKFVNILPTFEYGQGISLYVSQLLNVLTVKSSHNDFLVGAEFENTVITDGAIIKISSQTIGCGTEAVVGDSFYSSIEIITKDGTLSDQDKKACIDKSAIVFSAPGYYRYKITVKVGGEDVSVYNTVQVLEDVYAERELAATYGTGVINGEYSLVIDKYGRIFVNCYGESYSGLVNIPQTDDAFYANAYSSSGAKITLTATKVADKTVLVKCSGEVAFSEYFTSGTVSECGTQGYVLRRIVTNTQTLYLLSNSATAFGSLVTVVKENEADEDTADTVWKITDGSTIIYAKIVWGSTSNGLTIADSSRGTYTSAEGQTLVSDGFKNATIDGKSGTYTLYGNCMTFTSGGDITIYTFNSSNGTFAVYNLALDNSLVNGKSFSSTYSYTTSESYSANSATTTFSFGDDGVVKITSSSSDDDEDYGYNTYSPLFAPNGKSSGTYSVSGNVITITVEGYTLKFTIGNLLNITEIVCSSTNVTSGTDGYFAANTTFKIA
jgi:hypothetical protein